MKRGRPCGRPKLNTPRGRNLGTGRLDATPPNRVTVNSMSLWINTDLCRFVTCFLSDSEIHRLSPSVDIPAQSSAARSPASDRPWRREPAPGLASGRAAPATSSGVRGGMPGKHRPAAGQPGLAGAAEMEGVVAELEEQAERLGAADHRQQRRPTARAPPRPAPEWRRPDSSAPPCRSADRGRGRRSLRVRISRRRRAMCGPPSPELRPWARAVASIQHGVEEALIGFELERVRLDAARRPRSCRRRTRWRDLRCDRGGPCSRPSLYARPANAKGRPCGRPRAFEIRRALLDVAHHARNRTLADGRQLGVLHAAPRRTAAATSRRLRGLMCTIL